MKKIVPRYIATTLLKIKNKIIKATREKNMYIEDKYNDACRYLKAMQVIQYKPEAVH